MPRTAFAVDKVAVGKNRTRIRGRLSLSLKVSKPTLGTHTLGIHLVVKGAEVTTVNFPITIV